MATAHGERVRTAEARGERESDGARGAKRIAGGEVPVEAQGRFETIEEMIAHLRVAPDRVGRTERAEHAVVGQRFAGAKMQGELVGGREPEAGTDGRAHRAAAEAGLFVSD